MLVDISAGVKGIDGGERRLLEAEESADGLLRHDGVQRTQYKYASRT